MQPMEMHLISQHSNQKEMVMLHHKLKQQHNKRNTSLTGVFAGDVRFDF
jgi:hypothetical protein